MNGLTSSTLGTWIVIGFVFFALTMLAFVDVARKDFGTTGKKALWAVVALIPFVGWFIYLVLGMRRGSVTKTE
ncbi:PLDc N-terminal domain-containing protein [Desulfoluna spongiiphila]|uniref:Phospholipase_D-nuclease N-terminal n=1 Tax=Desulfoluna spongiiphila TaxID=419481 RepID=A0A1G5IQB4_9BACT|nr:PLDc N-terminal domain-containing protein [Desulfoluna spongiiphila]SCY77941.1 Phospholipase_D-nuclease N-terminal [Desulfoluna spongiiphila]VVS92583.1 cardiolipin synthase n-terminal [Desulfoluna spongiiphila]